MGRISNPPTTHTAMGEQYHLSYWSVANSLLPFQVMQTKHISIHATWMPSLAQLFHAFVHSSPSLPTKVEKPWEQLNNSCHGSKRIGLARDHEQFHQCHRGGKPLHMVTFTLNASWLALQKVGFGWEWAGVKLLRSIYYKIKCILRTSSSLLLLFVIIFIFIFHVE